MARNPHGSGGSSSARARLKAALHRVDETRAAYDAACARQMRAYDVYLEHVEVHGDDDVKTELCRDFAAGCGDDVTAAGDAYFAAVDAATAIGRELGYELPDAGYVTLTF